MAFHSQTIVRKHGFKTTWEMDEKLFDAQKEFSTKPETVEGMPDVQWYLECRISSLVYFYLVVELKYETEYSLEYRFLNSSNEPEKRKSVSNGNSKIVLFRMLKSEERTFVHYGKVTIELEASFLYKNRKFNNFHNCDEATEWGLYLKQSNSEDFSILVDGQTIGIHKFMLKAESSVFEKMFESNFKEAKEHKVTIPDFKYDIVKAATDYCYRQDISQFLGDHKNAMELLRFCDKYDFKTLKPKLEKHLALNLSKENVFYIASKADEANAPTLRQACIDFIRPLLNSVPSWPNFDMSEIDATFFKDIVAAALNVNNSA